jgi:hypothetical protein
VLALCSRLDALEHGTDPDRAAWREKDKLAIELLATRRIDRVERKRMADLAMAAIAPVPAVPTREDPASDRTARLITLHHWYEDCATTARAVIVNRNHLIRLGLACRRGRSGGASPPPRCLQGCA